MSPRPSISKIARDHRDHFFLTLSAFEKALNEVPFTMLRDEAAANQRLYARLKTLEKLISRRAEALVRF